MLTLPLDEVKEDSAVVEGGFLRDVEVGVECCAEVGLGEVGVEGFAAAEKFEEFGVGGGDPLDDEVAGGDFAAERGDAVEGDLADEQQVMDEGQHQDGVEVAVAAIEERGAFAVLPAGGGRGVGEIDAEGEDVLAACF